MTELKPCPFCGCPPHMDKHEIFCDCGVKFEFPLHEWGCSNKNPAGFPTYEQAKEVAVERWNEREFEPPRGRWVRKADHAKCSECFNECWADSVLTYDYCPFCGATMEQEG